jgi:hypothetical protein
VTAKKMTEGGQDEKANGEFFCGVATDRVRSRLRRETDGAAAAD